MTPDDFAHVFTIRGGRIAGFHEYMDSAAVRFQSLATAT